MCVPLFFLLSFLISSPDTLAVATNDATGQIYYADLGGRSRLFLYICILLTTIKLRFFRSIPLKYNNKQNGAHSVCVNSFSVFFITSTVVGDFIFFIFTIELRTHKPFRMWHNKPGEFKTSKKKKRCEVYRDHIVRVGVCVYWTQRQSNPFPCLLQSRHSGSITGWKDGPTNKHHSRKRWWCDLRRKLTYVSTDTVA